MMLEVWVIITGKGDRPYFQGKRPRRELIEKWHNEEGGVQVFQMAANVDDARDPERCWATVFEEPTPADPERWQALHELPDSDPDDSRQLRELRQAIDEYLGWADADSEEQGDYVARIVEVGRKVGATLKLKEEPADAGEPPLESDGLPKRRLDVQQRRMTRCQADDDGECDWSKCPQKPSREAMLLEQVVDRGRFKFTPWAHVQPEWLDVELEHCITSDGPGWARRVDKDLVYYFGADKPVFAIRAPHCPLDLETEDEN